MRCRNEAEARRQAQANANLTGRPWRYFIDPSGYAHCEAAPLDGDPPGQTWAGVIYTIVEPEQPNAAATGT
jgi:hypothetical protein